MKSSPALKKRREDTRFDAKKKQKNLCNLCNLWLLFFKDHFRSEAELSSILSFFVLFFARCL
jgi:hypothetical protein